jgi:hypothetical protein
MAIRDPGILLYLEGARVSEVRYKGRGEAGETTADTTTQTTTHTTTTTTTNTNQHTTTKHSSSRGRRERRGRSREAGRRERSARRRMEGWVMSFFWSCASEISVRRVRRKNGTCGIATGRVVVVVKVVETLVGESAVVHKSASAIAGALDRGVVRGEIVR